MSRLVVIGDLSGLGQVTEEGDESAETLEGLKDDIIDKIVDEVKDFEPEEADADTLVVHWR